MHPPTPNKILLSLSPPIPNICQNTDKCNIQKEQWWNNFCHRCLSYILFPPPPPPFLFSSCLSFFYFLKLFFIQRSDQKSVPTIAAIKMYRLCLGNVFATVCIICQSLNKTSFRWAVTEGEGEVRDWKDGDAFKILKLTGTCEKGWAGR